MGKHNVIIGVPRMIGVVRKFTGFEPSKEDQYAKFGGIEDKMCWADFYHVMTSTYVSSEPPVMR